MDRRLELENIIIGTLLDDVGGNGFLSDCRSCITVDMFRDEVNGRIYKMVLEMAAKGIRNITPSGIYDEYGDVVLDIMQEMLEKVSDFSFIAKKTLYNERQYLVSLIYDVRPRYTDIRFCDYVNVFLRMVYNGTDETGRKDVAA